ncbi:MAG TPA: hypothetical protein GXZ47_02185 [Treponema sp.]|nr:hypothetical protein [Treponema sp.]
MHFRLVTYPIFLLYELIRLFFIMKNGTASLVLPISWYAAVPLLSIVPVMLFMLSLHEKENAHWLPIISLIKAIGIPALILFMAQTLPTVLRFGTGGDISLLSSLISAVFFIIGDAIIGVYCFGRNRIVCK